MNVRLALATGVALVASLLAAMSAQAICIASTPAELRARAHVIFDGVALEGPTATGIQRFRVTRYRKGKGPAVARVRTGVVRSADGSVTTTSISLFVKKGERWRIFARGSAKRVLQSNYCDGSRRLTQAYEPHARLERGKPRPYDFSPSDSATAENSASAAS